MQQSVILSIDVSTPSKRVLTNLKKEMEERRMELDGRKMKILTAIIRNYLETGEPVGSRTISKYTDLHLSSATIRNEMSDLEEMGLIVQPHTSAGRIPTDQGYRLYVNTLLEEQGQALEEKDKEISQMKEVMVERVDRVELMLRQMAKMLAANTNYATMISGPTLHQTKLKFIQLSLMESQKLLIVIVAEGNIIKNTLAEVSVALTPETVLRLSLLLNNVLSGLSLEQISLGIITALKEQAGEYSEVVEVVLDAVATAMKPEASQSQVYTSGATNIFKYPELTSGGTATELISAFEEKEELGNLLNSLDGGSTGIQVYIGNETSNQMMQDCSIVTAKYELGDGLQGTIGIVGPKRMDYEKVMGTLQTLKEQLDQIYHKKE